MTNQLLNDEEAAQYLNISESWLRKSRVNGTGPAFCKIGRAVRYRLADLESYIEAQRATNTLRPVK